MFSIHRKNTSTAGNGRFGEPIGLVGFGVPEKDVSVHRHPSDYRPARSQCCASKLS